MTEYDVVVVGGGSAGCALASRLSDDARRSVLLLEAGPDYSEDELPDDLARSTNFTISHDWGFQSETLPGDRTVPLPRGKVLGGCSATNATYGVRGHRANYDMWADVLGSEWGYDRVLPAFRRMEHDLDVDGDLHGQGGPLPIRRYSTREMTPLQVAFRAAAEKLGHPWVPDHNDGESIGVGPAPMTSLSGVRQSAARRYVWPHRGRDNLTVEAGALVDRVRFDGRRAQAVVLADGREIAGRCIVLAAGAYGSPAILLRSGIGAADKLSALGIDVVAERQGVGENLQDHPLAVLACAAPEEELDRGLWGTVERTPAYQLLLTHRSSHHRGPGYDLHIVPQTVLPLPESPTGAAYAFLCSVVRPKSVGRVMLRSTDPHELPEIETGFLRHEDDVARLAECVKVARQLSQTEPLSEFTAAELAPGAAVETDGALAEFVKTNVVTYFHPVGSCRMGAGADAVVDTRGKVHDVEGLWVLDASVMPTIPGINTNLPTIMIAERGAAWLAAD